MAFGGEVHDRVDLLFRQQRLHPRPIANVGLDEAVVKRSGDLAQRVEVAGEGLSTLTTSLPLPTSRRTTALPMKPAPPVTRICSMASEARVDIGQARRGAVLV